VRPMDRKLAEREDAYVMASGEALDRDHNHHRENKSCNDREQHDGPTSLAMALVGATRIGAHKHGAVLCRATRLRN
jgi:hypothetical protein